MTSSHHVAMYNGKAVRMDYVSDPDNEFRLACQRIRDNGAAGYVITPDRQVWYVSQSSRKASFVVGDEKRQALHECDCLLAAAAA